MTSEKIPPLVVIWCDNNFQYEDSHESMKKEINENTETRPRQEPDEISTLIFDEAKEQFCLNATSLFTVTTSDDVERKIKENMNKKIFIISSGVLGRLLVPRIMKTYPSVHDFYIFAHNIDLHTDWLDECAGYVKPFDHPTNLVLRLTRDISYFFIKYGKKLLQLDVPQDIQQYVTPDEIQDAILDTSQDVPQDTLEDILKGALACFRRARNLENYANQRDKKDKNIEWPGQSSAYIEFRERLDLLEGEDGLIAKTEKRIRELGYSLESE